MIENKLQIILKLKQELADFPNAVLFDIQNFFEEDFFETKKVVYLEKKDI